MTFKATNPARGQAAGLGNTSNSGQAIDNLRDTSAEARKQALAQEARQAADTMVANGAIFAIGRAGSGAKSFTYELRTGGDRARCREILARAKRAEPTYWQAFITAIYERAETADIMTPALQSPDCQLIKTPPSRERGGTNE